MRRWSLLVSTDIASRCEVSRCVLCRCLDELHSLFDLIRQSKLGGFFSKTRMVPGRVMMRTWWQRAESFLGLVDAHSHYAIPTL